MTDSNHGTFNASQGDYFTNCLILRSILNVYLTIFFHVPIGLGVIEHL